jgi:hypothetical protein
VYASGERIVTSSGTLLVLNATRRLARGGYTLTLRSRHGHRWVSHRTRIVIS